MRAFLDTSALIKRYVAEPGREMVVRLMADSACVVSALCPVEMRGALRRRGGDGSLAAKDVAGVLARLAEDRNSWEVVPVSREVLVRAESLVAAHPLRSLDAIQVASAALLAAGGVSMVFITADRRQAEAAEAMGLAVRWVG